MIGPAEVRQIQAARKMAQQQAQVTRHNCREQVHRELKLTAHFESVNSTLK